MSVEGPKDNKLRNRAVGAVIGAGVGAGIGFLAGGSSTEAGIGAAAGAAAGFLLGEFIKEGIAPEAGKFLRNSWDGLKRGREKFFQSELAYYIGEAAFAVSGMIVGAFSGSVIADYYVGRFLGVKDYLHNQHLTVAFPIIVAGVALGAWAGMKLAEKMFKRQVF